MGVDPQTKRNDELAAKLLERKTEQEAEQKSKANKAKLLARNRKNLDMARRSGRTVNIVVARRDAGKVTLLIGDGHDPEVAAKGIHGHIDVTDHGLVATQNVAGPAFEAAMKQIAPDKITYKKS